MYFPASSNPADITHDINEELFRINKEFCKKDAAFKEAAVPPIYIEEDHIDGENETHILTSSVRHHYLTFLQNLLNSNYQCCARSRDDSDSIIKNCARTIEEKAVRSCMIVSLYRKSMLKIISKIRGDTDRAHLSKFIADELIRRDLKPTTGCVDAATQTIHEPQIPAKYNRTNQATENDNDMSLDEKIRTFEKKMKVEERKRRKFSNYLNKKALEEELLHAKKLRAETFAIYSAANTPESLPPPATPPAQCTKKWAPIDLTGDDNLTKELQKIFGTDPVEEIFGESSTNVETSHDEQPHTMSIVPFQLAHSTDYTEPVASYDYNEPVASYDYTEPAVSYDYNEPSVSYDEPPHNTLSIVPLKQPVLSTLPSYADELLNSIWPCEYHRQRLHLQHTLEAIAEKGWRHSEKVKRRWVLLFGEDDDDEFGPYSPSLAVDDILMSSCKKRIAPWIVDELREPMAVGLIANRSLFKKVAKRIAERVIVENQYPDAGDIQQAVAEFFSEHPRVASVNDIYK